VMAKSSLGDKVYVHDIFTWVMLMVNWLSCFCSLLQYENSHKHERLYYSVPSVADELMLLIWLHYINGRMFHVGGHAVVKL